MHRYLVFEWIWLPPHRDRANEAVRSDEDLGYRASEECTSIDVVGTLHSEPDGCRFAGRKGLRARKARQHRASENDGCEREASPRGHVAISDCEVIPGAIDMSP